MAKKRTTTRTVRKKNGFNKKEFSLFMLAFAVIGAFTLWVSLAAPHNGNGGGKPGGGGGTMTMKLVTDNNSDGLPNWNDTITFNVSTSATAEPHVSVTCYQNGTLVYSAATGYFSTYPWPWTNNMQLTSQAWTGGAADCSARMYYFDGKKTPTLATLSFHVNA
jgi:hypothetical protein